jgi:hypothetical protein
MVCFATYPSEDDDEPSSSVPSVGGVSSRTWCTGVLLFLLLERDIREGEAWSEVGSADIERRLYMGEWNEDGGCVDRERRGDGVVAWTSVGGGGLEFLLLSEGTPDKNDDTKLDGAEAVMLGTRLSLSLAMEIGVAGGGKGNVRFDDEAVALPTRLIALLLAARFESML